MKTKKVILTIALAAAAFLIVLGIAKAVHDNKSAKAMTSAQEADGEEKKTAEASDGKFHSKVYPDANGRAPEGATLEELFGQRFYPTDEILEADFFDPVMQFDDVILPTDGTATAGEILELLSGSSNAINYEFHSTKTEGEFELDDFKKVMEETAISACGEPGDFGYITIGIGMWGYADMEYHNFTDHELPASECAVTKIFPGGLAKENMFLGGGFRMDGAGITEESFLEEYLRVYEFGGEKTHPNEKTPMLGKYFTWPEDHKIVLYIPTDRTNAKGIRLDRTYAFFFDEENHYNYTTIQVDPHGFHYAEENGAAPTEPADSAESTAPAAEEEAPPAGQNIMKETPAPEEETVEEKAQAAYEVPDDLKPYQGYADENGNIVYAEWTTDEECVWAIRNYGDIRTKLPVYVKTKDDLVRYNVTWDYNAGHWRLVKYYKGQVEADELYDDDLIYPVG